VSEHPAKTLPDSRFVFPHSSSLTIRPYFRAASRDYINPHSPTFSIAYRVRRKRQRLPSSLVIENADSANAIGFGFEAFPMNANDYTSTELNSTAFVAGNVADVPHANLPVGELSISVLLTHYCRKAFMGSTRAARRAGT
jgi:hypothetical protein